MEKKTITQKNQSRYIIIKTLYFFTKIHPFIEKLTCTLIFVLDTNNVLYTTVWTTFFSIVQKYMYDVKVSRTRTFVREQRRTNVRPCGHTL